MYSSVCTDKCDHFNILYETSSTVLTEWLTPSCMVPSSTVNTAFSGTAAAETMSTSRAGSVTFRAHYWSTEENLKFKSVRPIFRLTEACPSDRRGEEFLSRRILRALDRRWAEYRGASSLFYKSSQRRLIRGINSRLYNHSGLEIRNEESEMTDDSDNG